jgi:Chagasin family peptidase inhibitor I42
MSRKIRYGLLLFITSFIVFANQGCASSQSSEPSVVLKINSLKSVTTSLQTTINVELDGAATNGYSWELLAFDKDAMTLLTQGKKPLERPLDGNTFTSFFKFKPLKNGSSKVVFGLMPPGRTSPEQTLEYQVTVK